MLLPVILLRTTILCRLAGTSPKLFHVSACSSAVIVSILLRAMTTSLLTLSCATATTAGLLLTDFNSPINFHVQFCSCRLDLLAVYRRNRHRKLSARAHLADGVPYGCPFYATVLCSCFSFLLIPSRPMGRYDLCHCICICEWSSRQL